VDIMHLVLLSLSTVFGLLSVCFQSTCFVCLRWDSERLVNHVAVAAVSLESRICTLSAYSQDSFGFFLPNFISSGLPIRLGSWSQQTRL
jgi:hypothetical protein